MWGAVIGGVASLASGLLGSKSGSGQSAASQAATQAQVEAMNRQIDEQARQYDTSRQDLLDFYNTSREDTAPYREAGTNALLALRDPGSNFYVDPGYAFRQREAMRSLNQGASTLGMLNSGARLKALQDRASDLASQEYGNWWNRQAGLAGIGQTGVNTAASTGSTATQGLVGAGNTYTQGVGNALAGIGQATGNNAINQANALTYSNSQWNNAIQGFGNALMSLDDGKSGSSWGGFKS